LVESQETAAGSDAGTWTWNFNTYAAVLFVGLAATIYFFIPYQIDKPLIVLGASKSDLPPETFPRVIAICLFILGIWFFFKSFFIDQINELSNLDREAWTNVTVTLIMMGIYVPLMVNLGFVVGSAIMIMAMSTYFGNRNYVLAGVISIALPSLMYWVFRAQLASELPPFPIDIYPLTNWSLL
jgi:hypothetical protein